MSAVKAVKAAQPEKADAIDAIEDFRHSLLEGLSLLRVIYSALDDTGEAAEICDALGIAIGFFDRRCEVMEDTARRLRERERA